MFVPVVFGRGFHGFPENACEVALTAKTCLQSDLADGHGVLPQKFAAFGNAQFAQVVAEGLAAFLRK